MCTAVMYLWIVIEVDGGLSLIEGHQICDRVEERLKRSHNIMHVHVHVEPKRKKSQGTLEQGVNILENQKRTAAIVRAVLFTYR